MDYSFFIKDVGALQDELLGPLIKQAQVLHSLGNTVSRFNVKVVGTTYQQDPYTDSLVKPIQELISSWKLPDLGGNPLVPYYTINWMDANDTLHEHSDLANGSSFDDLWTHKIHVPLITNRWCTFHFRRNFNDPYEVRHLAQGRVFVYNNSCMHKVTNAGLPRAHLIMYARDSKMVDYYSTTKIWKLLDNKA